MSQASELLKRIKRRPITARQARDELGIDRLAARICELREIGTPITTQRVRVKTRSGYSTIARYVYG